MFSSSSSGKASCCSSFPSQDINGEDNLLPETPQHEVGFYQPRCKD